MMKNNAFTAMFEEAGHSDSYHTERVLIEFTEEVVARMDALGISRAELARRLGAKPTYVTRILNGPENFTVKSMVRIARLLDCALRVHMQPKGAKSHWFDRFDAQRPETDSFDVTEARRQYKTITNETEAHDASFSLAS